MNLCRRINEHCYWIGVNDRRLQRFENMFPLDNGVSYNSYLILDEKICIMDSVDSSAADQYMANIEALLGERCPDYLVVQHMEPDHCGSIQQLLERYPQCRMVGNKKTFQLYEQFYDSRFRERYLEVADNDHLNLGAIDLRFILAPNVHWPEVMVTYDELHHLLFSADAFGSFGAIQGNLFYDELDSDQELPELRRYYSNIVGRQGASVQRLFKKLEDLELDVLCPLHGRVFRRVVDVAFILDKYQHWSTYTPEENGVVLFWSSMYGNMELAMDKLALYLSEAGVREIKCFDVSQTDPSYIIAELFRCSHFVVGGVNYNTELYFKLEALLKEALTCGVQKRDFALLVSKSWGGKAEQILKELLDPKRFTQLGETLPLLSSLKPEQDQALQDLAQTLAKSILKA